jgi:serine/threonine protein phosphatase PrpC
MLIEYAKVSALGDRQDNQDRAAVVVSDDAALMLVFDGMGGHSDGARAAETGLKAIQDLFMAGTQPKGGLASNPASVRSKPKKP